MSHIWWVVTLREDGDEEDSLEIVEAATEEEAVKRAEARFTVEADCDSDATIYINHIVRCESETAPTHVRVAPV